MHYKTRNPNTPNPSHSRILGAWEKPRRNWLLFRVPISWLSSGIRRVDAPRGGSLGLAAVRALRDLDLLRSAPPGEAGRLQVLRRRRRLRGRVGVRRAAAGDVCRRGRRLRRLRAAGDQEVLPEHGGALLVGP